MVTTCLWIFPSSPKTPNQKKESDLNHQSHLSDILCGYFDEKNWGSTLPGARVSRQRPVGRGWLATEKIQNRHFEKGFVCMVFKLTVYVRNVISFISQKQGEILIFGTFLATFSI